MIGAALVLMAGLFLIGEQNRLFTSKNRYTFTTNTAGGLNEGNPVRLNGVVVGIVEDVMLPSDVRKQQLTVRISIERRYEARIRTDSLARIRTLGLLGDKYVDVTSGSPQAAMIPPGGVIPTAQATDVDKLIASGGDVVDNMVRISYSLSHILERVDRGEGLVGALTTDESGKITDHIDATLASAQRVMDQVEHGRGPLGRMVGDQALGDQLADAVSRLQSVLDQADRGQRRRRLAAARPRRPRRLREHAARPEAASASLRTWTSARREQREPGQQAADRRGRRPARRQGPRVAHPRPVERRRQARPRQRQRRQADQRPADLRRRQRHRRRRQGIEDAALADPQPAEEGDRDALRRCRRAAAGARGAGAHAGASRSARACPAPPRRRVRAQAAPAPAGDGSAPAAPEPSPAPAPTPPG